MMVLMALASLGDANAFLRDFATRHGIRRLALFGSVLRGEDTPDSDIDLLVEKLVEIVGEAAKHVSHDLRESHPEVPWLAAARMRDRLVHHYFDINLDVQEFPRRRMAEPGTQQASASSAPTPAHNLIIALIL
jgi:predicted nucleotidyltransferase